MGGRGGKESSIIVSSSLSSDGVFENKTVFLLFPCSFFQDGLYLSLQRGVDWFAVMAGIPPERKYNSVLFGGRETEQTS